MSCHGISVSSVWQGAWESGSVYKLSTFSSFLFQDDVFLIRPMSDHLLHPLDLPVE